MIKAIKILRTKLRDKEAKHTDFQNGCIITQIKISSKELCEVAFKFSIQIH